MERSTPLRLALAFALVVLTAATSVQAKPEARLTVQVLTRDGRILQGAPSALSIQVASDGANRTLALDQVLSFHSAAPPTESESGRIIAGLAAVTGPDRKASEAAVSDLTDLGLPVLTPLLAAYKDTDAREPNPLYRLFGRIMPAGADAADRTLDLLRLPGGEILRGRFTTTETLTLTLSGTVKATIPFPQIRRLAVRQEEVERTFEVHSLRHCTYIAFLDTGITLSPDSRLESHASGFVRLDFNEDGWACGPDGLKKPLPGKRLMQEGFLWGTLLGRVGAGGERWIAGSHAVKTGLPAGRLYFVVNDNEHWQNNIGAYRVRLKVTHAYNLGEPQ